MDQRDMPVAEESSEESSLSVTADLAIEAINTVLPTRLLTVVKDPESLPGVKLTGDLVDGAKIAAAAATGAALGGAAQLIPSKAIEGGIAGAKAAGTVAGAAAYHAFESLWGSSDKTGKKK